MCQVSDSRTEQGVEARVPAGGAMCGRMRSFAPTYYVAGGDAGSGAAQAAEGWYVQCTLHGGARRHLSTRRMLSAGSPRCVY